MKPPAGTRNGHKDHYQVNYIHLQDLFGPVPEADSLHAPHSTENYFRAQERYREIMPRKFSSFLLILFLLLFTVQVSSSVAIEKKDRRFSDIILTPSETNLLVFGKLKNGFSEEMLQGLHNGIPIQFTFFVELNRVRKNWTDERIIEMSFGHTLKYDTLKETYKVDLEETRQKTFTFQSLAEAQKAMAEINGLKVIELSKLIPNAAYTFRIRADLSKKTLPMGLHHVIPFISWWDIETDWYSTDFTY